MKLKSLKALMASTVCAVLMSGNALAADYTLSVNTALATNDPLYAGLEALVKNVDTASKGRIEIKLFPNSQLGADEDVLEQARAGAPVAIVVDGGRLAVFQNEFGALGAPFLANGYDGIRKVVMSDMFEGWVQKLNSGSNLQVLSFNWWQGERHLLTQKPIKVPADLAGIRMRTPGAPVWIESIKAMGATPTPYPWGEVYSALSSNAIDGAEAQIPAIRGAKLNEVIKYVTKTGHINLITGLVTSGGWYNSLPKDLQKVLRDESVKAGDIASYGTRDSFESIEAELTASGVTINEVDVAPFKAATAGVYDTLGYGELRDTLRAIAAK